MIINKPQQFILFDCEQSSLVLNNLPQDIKNRIFKIFRVQQPVGGTFQAYVPDNVFGSQFSRLDSDNLYLIFTKPGQLGYEIPGAVDPEDYCSNTLLGISSNFSLSQNNEITKFINNFQVFDLINLKQFSNYVKNNLGKTAKISLGNFQKEFLLSVQLWQTVVITE